MKDIKEDISFKPTLKQPVSDLAKGFEKNFTKTMNQNNIKLNETDSLLTEREQSLKKKIFSLAKMEALVFSDPKLSQVYEEMAENGEEKYGYHYNETIQNMIFNDYVLNSPKYLQKYKMARPVEKKRRRDKSGINKLKKAGDAIMHKKPVNPIQTTPAVAETTGAGGGGAGAFVPALGYKAPVAETTTSASSGAYAGPAAWGNGDLLKGGKSKVMSKPIWQGGTIIQESNYLTDPSGFAKFVDILNEQTDADYIQNNSQAYGSVDNMSPADQSIIKKDLTTGKLDNPNLSIVETIGEKITTKDQLQQRKAQGLKITKDVIPQLAGEALHIIAIQLANRFLSPFSWDDLDDTNSMWDYIKQNGGMTFESLMAAVKRASQKRLKNAGYDGKMFEGMNEKASSPAQQRLFGMAHAVQKGELSPNKVGGAVKKIANTVSPEDVTDFASTKHDEMDETMQSIIDDKPDSMAKGTVTGTASPNGNAPMGLVDMKENTENIMKEEMDLLNEIDNELNAYSIHQKKLMQMAEDRKPSSLVLKDRLGAENQTNFKKDLQHSGTKEIINIEKELQWKDQQTDVKDPQKLGDEIENTEIKATKGEAFKNIGNSTNDKGDEVPKRNMTTAEQDEVNLYRKGMHSLVYDNKPDQRFEDRMKADMGDAVYEIREKQMADFGKQPMYNKEAQPTEPTKAVRTEFDKEKSGWNDPKGLSESMISGRYRNALDKSKIIDFTLNEVKFLKQTSEKTMETLFPLDFTGLGNSLHGRTADYKVTVNETVVSVLDEHKFFTDGKQIFAIKNPKVSLNEEKKEPKPPVRLTEEMNKMKHLLGYKTSDFVNTNNTKKNRGF